jgi:hypothetical protein
MDNNNHVLFFFLLTLSLSLALADFQEPPRDRKKVKNVAHSGDIPLDEIYEIARVMRPRSLAKDFKGTVLEVLGTASSVGCTVNRKDPREVQKDIYAGSVKVPAK